MATFWSIYPNYCTVLYRFRDKSEIFVENREFVYRGFRWGRARRNFDQLKTVLLNYSVTQLSGKDLTKVQCVNECSVRCEMISLLRQMDKERNISSVRSLPIWICGSGGYSNNLLLLSRRSRQRERLSAPLLSICLFVCLSVCLSPKCKTTRFSQKLSNLELRCLLTTYVHGLLKEPITGPIKSRMAEIRHLENRHDVIFFCRGWSDLDKISETDAE